MLRYGAFIVAEASLLTGAFLVAGLDFFCAFLGHAQWVFCRFSFTGSEGSNVVGFSLIYLF